jgi:hypothetical protein
VTRLLATLLAGATLVAFASVAAAACGDGGGDSSDLPLAEYFRRFDALDDDVASQQASLRERYPDPYNDPEKAREFYSDGTALLNDAANRLDALEPPPDVEAAHGRVLDALRVRADASQTILDDLADAESRDDVVSAVNAVSEDVDAALADLDEACLDLQAVADDNDVIVDLECETADTPSTPTSSPTAAP